MSRVVVCVQRTLGKAEIAVDRPSTRFYQMQKAGRTR